MDTTNLISHNKEGKKEGALLRGNFREESSCLFARLSFRAWLLAKVVRRSNCFLGIKKRLTLASSSDMIKPLCISLAGRLSRPAQFLKMRAGVAMLIAVLYCQR